MFLEPSAAASPASPMPAPAAVLLVIDGTRQVPGGNVIFPFRVSIFKLLTEREVHARSPVFRPAWSSMVQRG